MCTAASLPPLSPHSSLPDLPSKGEGVCGVGRRGLEEWGAGGDKEKEVSHTERKRRRDLATVCRRMNSLAYFYFAFTPETGNICCCLALGCGSRCPLRCSSAEVQAVVRWGLLVVGSRCSSGCGGGCAQPGGRPVTLGKILESYHRLTDAEQH